MAPSPTTKFRISSGAWRVRRVSPCSDADTHPDNRAQTPATSPARDADKYEVEWSPPTIPDLPLGLQLTRHARLALRTYYDPLVSRPSCTLTDANALQLYRSTRWGSILQYNSQQIDLSCTTVACGCVSTGVPRFGGAGLSTRDRVNGALCQVNGA